MLKDCVGEMISDIRESEWNEERKKHYDLHRAYFERGHFKILCDKCGTPLAFTGHYEFATYPKRQAVCTNKTCTDDYGNSPRNTYVIS